MGEVQHDSWVRGTGKYMILETRRRERVFGGMLLPGKRLADRVAESLRNES
jgi:ribulose 1,5-bisphosphate synthetase/thiazole synthase